jgi:hypothetical protein
MRIKYKTTIELSSQSDATIKDIGNINVEIISDLMQAGYTKLITIPAGVNNYLLNLDNENIRFIFLEANDTIKFKFNDVSSTEFIITPLDGNKYAHFLITIDNLSRIYISNPNTNSVELKLVFAGK